MRAALGKILNWLFPKTLHGSFEEVIEKISSDNRKIVSIGYGLGVSSIDYIISTLNRTYLYSIEFKSPKDADAFDFFDAVYERCGYFPVPDNPIPPHSTSAKVREKVKRERGMCIDLDGPEDNKIVEEADRVSDSIFRLNTK